MKIAQITWVRGNYIVTDNGKVYNNATGEELTPKIIRGYYSVHLINPNGERKNYRVHRLVYQAFCGEIPAGYHIDHINRDKLDNREENLRAVSPRENVQNSTQNGREKRGYSFYKGRGKWRAGIEINKTRYFLGLFNTEDEAKGAYETALRQWNEKGETPAERRQIPKGLKHCSGCGQNMPYMSFYYVAKYKRYSALCRECHKAQMRERRAKKKTSI